MDLLDCSFAGEDIILASEASSEEHPTLSRFPYSPPRLTSPPAPARVSSSLSDPFDAVVFAGGGCRCFWQAGFWSTAHPLLGLRPKVVAGTSAGAAFACAAVTDRTLAVLADFKRRAAANERNFYLENRFAGSRVFPHEEIYRGAILASLHAAAFERLQTGPDLRVLIARPPRWLGPRTGLTAAVVAHLLDRRASRVHPRWGRRFGFRQEVVTAQSCESVEELADLILQASCMPPIVPLYRRGESIVLDGGLIDNAPADIVGPAQSVLVLLSKRFPDHRVPRIQGRTYVGPSREIPILKWDYTSPELIQQTFDLGRRDGESFARETGRGSMLRTRHAAKLERSLVN